MGQISNLSHVLNPLGAVNNKMSISTALSCLCAIFLCLQVIGFIAQLVEQVARSNGELPIARGSASSKTSMLSVVKDCDQTAI